MILDLVPDHPVHLIADVPLYRVSDGLHHPVVFLLFFAPMLPDHLLNSLGCDRKHKGNDRNGVLGPSYFVEIK